MLFSVSAAKPAFQESVLLWVPVCWFAVRARIDAFLFRILVTADGSLEDFDALMTECRLLSSDPPRSIEMRSAGSLRLLCWLVACVVLHVGLFVLGIVIITEYSR